jgi:hypothetical protein
VQVDHTSIHDRKKFWPLANSWCTSRVTVGQMRLLWPVPEPRRVSRLHTCRPTLTGCWRLPQPRSSPVLAVVSHPSKPPPRHRSACAVMNEMNRQPGIRSLSAAIQSGVHRPPLVKQAECDSMALPVAVPSGRHLAGLPSMRGGRA